MSQRLIIFHHPSFQEQALNEIRRLSEFRARGLASGVTQVDIESSYKSIRQKWRKRPPIYVHHLMLVQRQVETLATLEPWITAQIDSQKGFQLQFLGPEQEPSSLREVSRLERRLAQRFPCYRHSDRVISVARSQKYLVGLSTLRDNLSPWPGGVPPRPTERGQLNRAEPKLKEALFHFGLKARSGLALDLGSSQGGWSRVLLKRGYHVVGVDPKVPDRKILDHPRFRHEAMLAEEYLEGQVPTFDLITNDMILWPADSARLMVSYASKLRRGCPAIMTLKVGCKKSLGNTDHALRILRKAYRIPRLKQLYHNGLELTAWLVRK